MKRRTSLLRTLSAEPWAMHPRALAALYRRVMDDWVGGADEAPMEDAPTPEPAGGVLVLPVRGTIVHHGTDAYGARGSATPTEWLIDALDYAEGAPEVSAVVLAIDSGGGMAAGTPEAAERIFRFRDSGKRLVAVADTFAASAAYYLGAAAGEFYVSPSGEVGSIGTLLVHEDVSEMLSQIGVKVEILRATLAENKARMNPFEPLSAEERARAVEQLDTINARFLADVERFRGMEPGTVAPLSELGRTFLADEAASLGLVDGVRTLRDVLAELNAPTPPAEEGEPASEPEDVPLEREAPEGAEVRSLEGVEVRAVGEDGGTLAGVAVRYRSLSVDLGGFREEFAPDAFADSLAEDDIRVLWQHDGRFVFGRVRAGTAKVWSEAVGLHYEATPPDAQWARDAMESIRRGDVDQNSFAFMVPKGGDKWERRAGELVRTVTKARLLEVGPQTNPAYPDTTVAVRGMQDFLAAEGRAALEIRKRRFQMERARGAA